MEGVLQDGCPPEHQVTNKILSPCSAVEQLVEISQTRAVGESLRWAARMLPQGPALTLPQVRGRGWQGPAEAHLGAPRATQGSAGSCTSPFRLCSTVEFVPSTWLRIPCILQWYLSKPQFSPLSPTLDPDAGSAGC